LVKMYQDYIIKYRSQVKGANKSQFLLLSHQSGASKAMPMSIAAVDKMFGQLSKALGFNCYPHALRHTWNDNFSEMVDEAISSGDDSQTLDEIEDIRSWQMGWQQGSDSAKTYTKRFNQKNALKIGLKLQEKRLDIDKGRRSDPRDASDDEMNS